MKELVGTETRPWASYQIQKYCGLRMRRECRERFSRHLIQRKPLVSDPGMHHGSCVTHVPWCMSGSLTRGGGENVPGIPDACATHNFTYLARGPWQIPTELSATAFPQGLHHSVWHKTYLDQCVSVAFPWSNETLDLRQISNIIKPWLYLLISIWIWCVRNRVC